MNIIDFHTHCFPDAVAARALETLSAKATLPYLHDGTAAGLDAYERAEGCQSYLVLPIATSPRQVDSILRFAAGLRDERRGVYAFGSVHPETADYVGAVARMVDWGLKGVKFHPEYQEFYPDAPKMFPIYEEIFRQGLPVLFHAGEDEGYRPPWHSEPRRIAAVARRYPEGVVIAAHMGGHKMRDEAAECLACLPNVYADVSFDAGRLPQSEFEESCRRWRPDRLLFGSDSPWQSPGESIAAVKLLPFTEEEKALVFAGNAERILRL